MAADQILSEEAQRLLAQYPGPVKISQPKRRLLLGYLTLFLALPTFLWVIHAGENTLIKVTWFPVPLSWLGYIGLVFMVPLVLVAVLAPLGGGYRLILDDRGFRRSHALFERHKWFFWNIYDPVPWGEASNFTANTSRSVEFSRANRPGGSRWENYCRQALGTLPGYSLRADDLAALMNAWRSRALS